MWLLADTVPDPNYGAWPNLMQWGAVGVLVMVGLWALKMLVERAFKAFDAAITVFVKRCEELERLFRDEMKAQRDHDSVRTADIHKRLDCLSEDVTKVLARVDGGPN